MTGQTPQLVDAHGRPMATPATSAACPRCQAPPTRRVLASGFGEPHDACGQCGHDFPPERTQ
jgi:uncharacterized protein (DUF983 family)